MTLFPRHPDIVRIESSPGRPALVRRDQLLIAPGAPSEAADRWTESRHDLPGVTLLRLRPAAGVDVCELAVSLRPAVPGASPNHVMTGQPGYWGGPAHPPAPAGPVPGPVPAAARREVTVGLLDTGLSPHPWYGTAAWFTEQREGIREVLDADRDHKLDAQAGHGTFAAGLLLRRHAGAHLRVRRVLGSDGVGDELGVLRGIGELRAWSRATGRPVDLVNLSLGGHTFDDQPPPLLARALDGVVAVAAAGNGGASRPFWPAALPGVIGVGALDATGLRRAAFSNHGPWVAACARGEDLTSSFVWYDGGFAGYARWSGTSFAAATVSGVIAAHAAVHGIDARAAAADLLSGGEKVPGLGVRLGR
ncbi:S8 family peptidase [Bailinhaonella thermotolerans]|uniref:Peptidase S8 and S53 subtilisin kexin sedolisin n=1 Tax=Bailinhaonella thermotolerans TaxID=1070861 RepID=A0A3A4BSU6_9ACTN|nr:S8/S53 family peptidase [Bailinhaonella thermotolerans]RJL34386.1 peptidase S8 and S53 subtilisin kexin sedolisin [Bailinhaonella thermotolerans]